MADDIKKIEVWNFTIGIKEPKKTACEWAGQCPTYRNEVIDCNQCPAVNTKHPESKLLTQKEAVSWWKKQDITKHMVITGKEDLDI